MIKKDKLITGALILAIGGFLTKVIGVFYRIPLTNILGAEGIGIYQMVFPLYCLLLTVSSTGVPNGISKLIAEGNDPNEVLKSSLKLFIPIGLIGSIFMTVFARKISLLQGNILAKNSYIFLAPSILAVSVISCLRGYFQGFTNMKPTAISQILEQTIKLIFGLTLCYFIKGDVSKKASLATLSVTISEVCALIFLAVLAIKKSKGLKSVITLKSNVKVFIKTVFPVMLSTVVMPLTRTIEGFFIINVLNKYLQNATSLYGIYSGVVESIIGVPVSVLYGIAVTSVPIISSNENELNVRYNKAKRSIILTLVLGLVFAIMLYLFSPLAVKILYRKLLLEEKALAIKMLRLASLSVVFLPLMQTLSSTLIALGYLYVPVSSSLIASSIKILLSICLLNVHSLNIFAVVITDIVCYILACFINLVYIILKKKKLKEIT